MDFITAIGSTTLSSLNEIAGTVNVIDTAINAIRWLEKKAKEEVETIDAAMDEARAEMRQWCIFHCSVYHYIFFEEGLGFSYIDVMMHINFQVVGEES
jgi:hypothetical protein